MIVVSDTTPIHYLTLIGYVDLLWRIFGAVVIPAAVADELRCSAAPLELQQLIAQPPAWLDIRRPATASGKPLKLGRGEAEAILLQADQGGSALG